MIGSLHGTVLQNNGDYILLEVGGVGYKVFISGETAAELFSLEIDGSLDNEDGKELFLYTHHVIREDARDLYGFRTEREVTFFQHLISISGIGPKSGLGILSIAPIDVLQSAIAAGDTSYLTKVSGVGKKSAQKIVLELQDKIAKELELSGATDTEYNENSDVMDALLALGYQQTEARAAIKSISVDASSTQEKLREVLKYLQR